MPSRDKGLPDWAQQELASLSGLHGLDRLSRAWQVGERLRDSGDTDAYVEWLKQMMTASWKEARFDYKLRAFGELRRIYREDPRYADLQSDILWYYKWLVEELPEHLDVTLETMTALFDDMEGAYREAGVSLRPVYQLRSRAAVLTGRPEEATRWYDQWQAEPAGRSDDCAACEADRQVAYLIDQDRHAEALAAAEPVLRGQVWCDDSPETLTRVVGAAIRTDRFRLAQVLLKVACRPVRQSRSMLAALSAQVVYHMMTGDPQRAGRLALVCLRRAKDSINDTDLYAAYRACGSWAALAVLVGGADRRVPARLMPGDGERPADGVPVAEVAGLCLAEAGRIAKLFDARNGTSRYVTYLNEFEEFIRRSVAGRADEGGREA
jgi:hypothetical protein